jgi:hypothetical protein
MLKLLPLSPNQRNSSGRLFSNRDKFKQTTNCVGGFLFVVIKEAAAENDALVLTGFNKWH